MALADILNRAKAHPQRIVFPEGDEPRTLQAAQELVAQGIAQPILLGNAEGIRTAARAKDVSLYGVTVVEPGTSPLREKLANNLFHRREKKGMTKEQAWELSKDPMYFGVLMVDAGHADGEVSGAVHSTADTLRPALQVIGCAKGIRLVSSAMVMELSSPEYGEGGTLVFADCGLVVDPSAEDLASIAASTADTARRLLDITPKIAMLSFSTKGSGKGPVVDKVERATCLITEQWPDLRVDGSLQADAALVPWVGKKKAPDSQVAGQANVLIFPDLQSGNIGYKLVERLANAQAIGPILQGLAKPVNDLSRGCSAGDIVNVAAITSLQALASDRETPIAG
ncbi:MAG TPA: phosphate acetyltransferase [Armatimonadota bacterium]|jgi:phosphate acetyltransferase